MSDIPLNTSTDLVIAGIVVHQDIHGRYNLNDLYHARDVDKEKRPHDWLKLKSTQELIAELSRFQDGDCPLDVVHGGARAGTYAHELLAVEYAGWISPSFRLQVNQAFIDRKTQKGVMPVLHDERTAIAIQTLVRLDNAEHRIKLLEDNNRRQEVQLARAETKADMAMSETHRFTIEEFVGRNGLVRQFPESTWPAASRWLKEFCGLYGLEIGTTSVPGKRWPDEKAYPLQALMAWQRSAARMQMRLVTPGGP